MHNHNKFLDRFASELLPSLVISRSDDPFGVRNKPDPFAKPFMTLTLTATCPTLRRHTSHGGFAVLRDDDAGNGLGVVVGLRVSSRLMLKERPRKDAILQYQSSMRADTIITTPYWPIRRRCGAVFVLWCISRRCHERRPYQTSLLMKLGDLPSLCPQRKLRRA